MIRYRGTSPSLAEAKRSAHTRCSIFLWWWRRRWWWWRDHVLQDQEILQSAYDASEEDDVLLMQNIFMSEVFILHADRFNDLKGCNLSRGKMSIVRLKDIFFLLLDRQCLFSHRGWIYGSLWYVSNVSIIFDCSMLFYYQSWMFYNHFISFFGTNLLT